MIGTLFMQIISGEISSTEERRWYSASRDEALSQTVALNTLVFFEMVYLFNSRSLTEPALSMDLRANKWIPIGVLVCFILQLLITYWGPFNHVFHTEAIGLLDWATALAIASSAFFAIEVEKYIVRRTYRAEPSEDDHAHI